MSELNFSVQNIVDGNGVSIALMGMMIVFCGLAMISLFIALLPKILALLQGKPVKAPARHVHHDRPSSETEEITAAIGYVIHMEFEKLSSDNQKVTLEIEESSGSSWALSNRMRTLPQ